ncbi:unnamed protein product [Mytilus coruscus]|uniref:DUF6589 domain-containing protein n=1 Tax=Mytilus coruscus TaxID=42192 RepID=A0A6J8EYW7_MYTCO|nr:unnamed protein product [Mytilus coruscus]
MFICEKCANACKHFNNFRGRAKQNLDYFISNHTTSRTKRMPKTPPSSMKISTADQIENSVEKLRNLNLDEKEKGARVVKKSRQQLNFSKDLNLKHAYSQQNVIKYEEEDQVVLLQDHEYSIPNNMDKALETSEKIAEDLIKEASTCINSYNSYDSLDKQISSVCKLGKSVLFKSSAKDLSERNWFLDIGREMLQHCPEFLSLLLSAIGDKITLETKLATVCTIYGMLMHCRNTRASAIQKLYTSFCIRYHTDNKLLHRLNKVQITMSDESERHIMRDLSNHSNDMIKEQIAKRNDGKLNRDNLDIYVTTNDIRMDNKNRDYHFFASDITFDRVKISHLNNSTPIGNAETVELKEMIPSLEEDILYKSALKVILSQVIVKHCDSFNWMKPIIPKHISHPLQDVMSTKSSIHWLQIMLKNEAKYADCVQIMASYEDQLSTWYRKAGRGGDLDKLQVPVGGDQLTRVRLKDIKKSPFSFNRTEFETSVTRTINRLKRDLPPLQNEGDEEDSDEQ